MPDARLRVYARCGHSPMREALPAFLQDLLGFLAEAVVGEQEEGGVEEGVHEDVREDEDVHEDEHLGEDDHDHDRDHDHDHELEDAEGEAGP